MAAGLQLARAHVITPAGEHARVGVMVRLNVAKLYEGRTLVAEMDGVTAVTQVVRNKQWTVAGTGGEWTVTRLGGCGCGGR